MKLIDIFQKLDESSVNEAHVHDDYEDCDMCNGTGEGRWEGETCHACHGSGVQEPEHDDDDFDIPDDDDFDGGDEESYYEKSLRSRGLEEELAMKHQRDHKTQQFPDTSNSLAKRSYQQAEVPNVTKSADGHPTVKYRADSTKKAVHSRVEPTITPTTVKRKDSDRPIPSFLQKEGVAEGTSNVGNAIKSLCQKIYAAGDDEFEYFYHDSPIFAQYWDEYEGDLDSIIAEVDPGELQVMLDELESYVQQANLAEGDKKPEPPEADYGDDYQAMVARVKKLAGLGPLKTVYDPEKRVYKNVPVAVQPKK